MGDVLLKSKTTLDLELLILLGEFIPRWQGKTEYEVYDELADILQYESKVLKKGATKREIVKGGTLGNLFSEARTGKNGAYDFPLSENNYKRFCNASIDAFDNKVLAEGETDDFDEIKTAFIRWYTKLDKEFNIQQDISEDWQLGWIGQNTEQPKKVEPKKQKSARDEKLEKYLNPFTQQKVHYYHLTRKYRELYWNHLIFDFTSNKLPCNGELYIDITVADRDKIEQVDYTVRLLAETDKDTILLSLIEKNGGKTCHNIFDSIPGYRKEMAGVMYHDDWNTVWRVSGSLLSFTPIENHTEEGPLPPDIALKVQDKWNILFLNPDEQGKPRKPIFEEYKLPSQ